MSPQERESSAPPQRQRGYKPKFTFRDHLDRLDVKVSPYLYIAPFFIIFALTGLYPLLYTAFISLHKWHLISGNGGFVGLGNFVNVLGQGRFWQSLGNTFSIFVLSAVPQLILSVWIAAVLDANLRAKTFWRLGVLLPYVVTPVAVSVIFSKLFADQSGLINGVLSLLGGTPIMWHVDPLAAHFAISVMVNFRWTGYNSLIILAAMQAIPRELYEAAIIDGASRMRRFFSITIPMLRPTLIFVVLTSTIGGLQIFDEPTTYDGDGKGGANRQWQTTAMYLYQMGWGNTKDFGRAAAVAWILFIIIIVLSILNYLLVRLISSEEPSTKKKKKKRVTPPATSAKSSTKTTPAAQAKATKKVTS
ncbi:MAG: sugar ABC transporter permease [Actinomycetaceae bacterium]|nr:sugar ABC transporter permease [Actinomycetaceae bacterium]